MPSSRFVRAAGIKAFELKCPIGLQLACMGSKSTINYGTSTTIMVSKTNVKEYFDITNVDYYDAVL